ncbi:MAG: hypothetical protein Q9172_001094 [Xanthocarpia lactea]
MSTTQSYTDTEFGRRLIPSLIDQKAATVPEETYCFIPWTSKIEHGFRPVSFRCLANAIDTCAWWIKDEIGTSQGFDTLAYLGPSDLRNTIIIIAAIKTGHKALLASPRNHIKAHLALLQNTLCNVLLTPDPPSKAAQEILSHRPMKRVVVPEIDRWLDAPLCAPFPYIKTFEQARYEPFVVVHTSGSTGLPKVVVLNHGSMAASDAFNDGAVARECGPMVLDAIRNKRCFVSMPSFHIAGVDFMLAKALFHGIVPVLSPTGAPITAELVDAMHGLNLIEISVVAPSILQDIASSPVFLENLRRLGATIYGGGPLPPNAGNAIVSKTKLYNFMGSSEMANVPTEEVEPQDWEYLKFSPKLGYQMRHHSGDLFELCFHRQPHLDLYQGIFSTLPNCQEYFTSDLYSKHPTKPDLWKYQGRADDIMTLTNGEKVNPVAMEKLIEAHPGVRSVLVVGQARFQTALIVEAREPPTSCASRQTLIESLWPTVEKANMQCDAHAKIARDLILFTTAEKPFLRAGKGTVQRRMTVDAYHGEINKMYNDFETLTTSRELDTTVARSLVGPQMLPNGSGVYPEALESRLEQLVCKVMGESSIDHDRDFFEMGMDSLQILNLVRGINAEASAAAGSMTSINATTVYANPSISRLTEACSASLLGDVTHIVHNAWEVNFNLPLASFEIPHLLGVRQFIDFSARSAYGASILFISSVSSTMGWSVNHSGPVPECIIDDCSAALPMGYAQSKYIAERLLGTASSIAGVPATIVRVGQVAGPIKGNSDGGCWNKREWLPSLIASSRHLGKIPVSLGANEEIDWIPIDVLSEVLVELMGVSGETVIGDQDSTRHSTSPFHTATKGTSDRIGGLYSVPPYHSVNGDHPEMNGCQEKTSHPFSKGFSITDADAGSKENQDPDRDINPTTVYHAVNPNHTTWTSLLPTIRSHFSERLLEIVSLQEWISALKESADATLDVDLNPAIRLLDFYQILANDSSHANPVFETSRAVDRTSDDLDELADSVDADRYWNPYKCTQDGRGTPRRNAQGYSELKKPYPQDKLDALRRDAAIWSDPHLKAYDGWRPYHAFLEEVQTKHSSVTHDEAYKVWKYMTPDERWPFSSQADTMHAQYRTELQAFNARIPLSPLVEIDSPGEPDSDSDSRSTSGEPPEPPLCKWVEMEGYGECEYHRPSKEQRMNRRNAQNWNRYRCDHPEACGGAVVPIPEQPFRFLRLLPELRIAIYRFILCRTKPLVQMEPDQSAPGPQPKFPWLAREKGPVDVRIFVVCKQVYEEATNVFFRHNIIKIQLIGDDDFLRLPSPMFRTGFQPTNQALISKLKRIELDITTGRQCVWALKRVCLELANRTRLKKVTINARRVVLPDSDSDPAIDDAFDVLMTLRGVGSVTFTESSSSGILRDVGTQAQKERVARIMTTLD